MMRWVWFLLLGLAAGCAGSGSVRGVRIEADHSGDEAAPRVRPDDIYRKSYAVVIGIGPYRSLPTLPDARNDAEHMATLLGSQGFEVTTILDREATRRLVVEELSLRLPARLEADDRVLIYFAGHGATVGQGEGAVGYLMPVEGESGSVAATGISMREIQLWFQSYPAKHVFFVADACYSGLALSTRRGHRS